jgi:hypothetical protein
MDFRIAIVLGVAFTFAACAPTPPALQIVAGINEVDLRWQPRAGMRLVQHTRAKFTVSGAFAQSLAPHQRSVEQRTTQRFEILLSTTDFFDVRIEGSGVRGTARFARDFRLLRLRVDGESGGEIRLDQGKIIGLGVDPARAEEIVRKFQPIQDLFAQNASFYKRWRVGEDTPFRLIFPGVPGQTDKITVNGSALLKRVVLIHGRSAAEIDYEGAASFPMESTTARLRVSGKYWSDLLTGVYLMGMGRATGTLTLKGQAAQFDVEQNDELDLAQSSL